MAIFGRSFPIRGVSIGRPLLSAAAVSGTLSVTEGADSAALAGGVLVQGTLAATDGADIAAVAGNVVVQGTLSGTEGSDSAAAIGAILVQGTLSATDGADSAGIAGAVLVQGTLAATEGADTASLSGVEVVVPPEETRPGSVKDGIRKRRRHRLLEDRRLAHLVPPVFNPVTPELRRQEKPDDAELQQEFTAEPLLEARTAELARILTDAEAARAAREAAEIERLRQMKLRLLLLMVP